MSLTLLRVLDRWRHRIPFWWWITYDVLVGLVIGLGCQPWGAAWWLGYGTLAVAVCIDTVEFFVKSPWARRRLAE